MTKAEILKTFKDYGVNFNELKESDLEKLECIIDKDSLLNIAVFMSYCSNNRELLSKFFKDGRRTDNILRLNDFLSTCTEHRMLLSRLIYDMKIANHRISNGSTYTPTNLLNCAINGYIPLQNNEENDTKEMQLEEKSTIQDNRLKFYQVRLQLLGLLRKDITKSEDKKCK